MDNSGMNEGHVINMVFFSLLPRNVQPSGCWQDERTVQFKVIKSEYASLTFQIYTNTSYERELVHSENAHQMHKMLECILHVHYPQHAEMYS